MTNDFRYALRAFLRTPGFAAVAILTLALGIGATTAMFSVVQAAVIQPVPYPEPGRLCLIFEEIGERERGRLTALDFVDLQRAARSFESMAAHTGTGFTFAGDGDAELVVGQLTSAAIFDVLKTPPALGSPYTPADNQAGRETVVVLSHGLWQRRFGADPAIINRVVAINGKRFRVSGVMPRGFEYPNGRYALWTPLALSGALPDGPPINRSAHYIQVIARLKPGVTMDQAQQELDALSRQMGQAHPHQNLTLRLEPLTEAVAAPTRRALLLLLAGVVCLLLIACANVTALMLARATARAGELAIRAALGATRWRLARQLLTETIVLYVIGGGAGMLLASWALDAVRRLGPDDVPRLQAAALNGQVLLFALAATLLPALLFGVAPSFRSALSGVRSAGDSRTTTAAAATGRARGTLVVVQLALSVVLLVAAGLVARSFVQLQGVDEGFDAEGVITFSLVLPQAQYPTAPQMAAFADRLVETFQAHPGLVAAGTTTALPLSGQNVENGFTIDGHAPPPGLGVVGGIRGVNADYFRTMGTALREGRPFSIRDDDRAARVVIVNERFARQYLSRGAAIGSRMKMGGADSEDPWRTVVGIAADVHHAGPAEAVRPEVFFPYRQLDPDFLTMWGRGLYVALRVTGDPDRMASIVRGTVKSINPNVAVNNLQPMRALQAEAVSQPRFRFLLFSAFAAVAATLAAVGLFGVMAFFVAQRTREIGIRVALGASAREIVGLIAWRAGRLAALGVGLGLAGAAAAARALQSILFGVTPLDPLTFGAAAMLLLAAGATATYIPARRALRVDPVTALRAE